MSTTTHERFRLQFVGADEDLPRLLLAYGRACGGEVAFVMRPRDNTALLIHQVKKAPAKVWRTDLGLAPSHPPELDIDASAAVAEIRTMKASPPPAGPATLKGKWAGVLVCDNGTPRVTLERKVAAYGTLQLVSLADGRWQARFDRAARWFSKARQETVERSSLADAITAGMGLVVGLVSEACSFRDTRRRNTVDAEYAAQHPYTPPREPKDPTERYQPKSSFRAVEQEDGWVVVNDVGAVFAKFGKREKGKGAKHASALTPGDRAGRHGGPGPRRRLRARRDARPPARARALRGAAPRDPGELRRDRPQRVRHGQGGRRPRRARAHHLERRRHARHAPARRQAPGPCCGAGEVHALLGQGAQDGVGRPAPQGRRIHPGA